MEGLVESTIIETSGREASGFPGKSDLVTGVTGTAGVEESTGGKDIGGLPGGGGVAVCVGEGP